MAEVLGQVRSHDVTEAQLADALALGERRLRELGRQPFLEVAAGREAALPELVDEAARATTEAVVGDLR